MCARRVLPIALPDIASYAHLSYFLSVMHTDSDTLKWVYSNFVQLRMSPHLFIDYFTPQPENEVIPCLHGSQRIDRRTVNHFSPDIIEFIRFQIDNGYYFWTYVNDYYVPETLAYRNHSYTHALMVYGYDDIERVFYISGFFADQRYGTRTISYELMEKAFSETEFDPKEPAQELVYLIKIHELRKNQTDFRLSWVMNQLEDYLHSKDSSERLGALQINAGIHWVYGMKIYDELQRRIRVELQEGKRLVLDPRPYYIVWEHKKLMNRRLAYMSEQGHFQFSDSVREGYQAVENLALTIRNMKIKFLITSNDKLLHQIDNRLEQLKLLERNLIANMLEQYCNDANPCS